MKTRTRLPKIGMLKGYLFCQNGIWKGKGLDLGAEPPRIKLCYPPPRVFKVHYVFLFAVLLGFAKANHKRWIQICCETSWSFSRNTRSKTKSLLQKVELESTLCNMLPQLATLNFVAWQVGHKRGATEGFNPFQLALQQCYETRRRKMLPVLPDLCLYNPNGSGNYRSWPKLQPGDTAASKWKKISSSQPPES